MLWRAGIGKGNVDYVSGKSSFCICEKIRKVMSKSYNENDNILKLIYHYLLIIV